MSTLRARYGPFDRLRIGPWRGDPAVAQVALVGRLPSDDDLRRCLDELAARGYRNVLTSALGPLEQQPFLRAGFEEHERLHLLGHRLRPLPDAPLYRVRRARRSDREAVTAVDAAAFDAFWRLDAGALDDALAATPSVRFRVWEAPAGTAGVGVVAGYAITGRAGKRGYLQRLAVAPAHQRRGGAAALVRDGLRWVRRWGGNEVMVNTQEANHGALAAYLRLGFELRPHGLAVLRRALP